MNLRRLLTRSAFAVLALLLLWTARYHYDHVVVDGDTYLVRVHRVTGDADILVPGEGWVPAEETWSDAQEGFPGPPA